MNITDMKGVFATWLTGLATITAWLPSLEAILRIGASLAAISAGVYAAMYWRAKKKNIKDANE